MGLSLKSVALVALLVLVAGAARADSYLYQKKGNVWGQGVAGWTQILGTNGPDDPQHQIACGSRIGPSLGYSYLIDSYGEGCTPPLGRPTGTGSSGPWVVDAGATTSSYYNGVGCTDLPQEFPAPSWYIMSSANCVAFLLAHHGLPGTYHYSLVGGDQSTTWTPPARYLGYIQISAPRDPAWQITVQLKHDFGTFPWLDYSTQSGTLHLMQGNYTLIYSTAGFYREYVVSCPGGGKTNKYVLSNNGASQVTLIPDTGNTTATPIPNNELPSTTDYEADEAAAAAGSGGGGTYTGPPADNNWFLAMFRYIFVPHQEYRDMFQLSWSGLGDWGPGAAIKSFQTELSGIHNNTGPVTGQYIPDNAPKICFGGSVNPYDQVRIANVYSQAYQDTGDALCRFSVCVDLRCASEVPYTDGTHGTIFGTWVQGFRPWMGAIAWIGWLWWLMRRLWPILSM